VEIVEGQAVSSKQSQLEQVAQDIVQLGFEHLQPHAKTSLGNPFQCLTGLIIK